MIIRTPLIAITLFTLTACGFQPLYGSHAPSASFSGSATEVGLDQIAIGNIPNREGVFLRNALIDRFYRGGVPNQPRYELTMTTISESKAELDITTSAEATRAQLTQSTVLSLQDKQSPASTPSLVRTLTSVTSYNLLESEFATRASEEAARQSGLNDLARQAELQLSLFLNRQRDAVSKP